MSKRAFKIVNLIIAVLVFAFAIGHAFAWLADDRKEEPPWFDGSSGETYFAGGNGLSEETAYEIENYYHMYNLAWLQNTGKLGQSYYFKLNNDITIPNNFWLPPIGTDNNPFIGKFNGNGNTISGLKITTDTSKLSNAPTINGGFSNAVGMFGMTGATGEIKNFVLDDPWVEVFSNESLYDSDGAAGTASAKTVGLAIGYANCGASNIGVYQGELGVKRSAYTTINSIVGGASSDVDASDIDNSDFNGNDGDTGQFIPDKFYDILTDADKGVSSLSNLFDTDASNSEDGYVFKPNIWVVPNNKTADNFGLGAFSFVRGAADGSKVTSIKSNQVTKFTYYTTTTDVDGIPTYGPTYTQQTWTNPDDTSKTKTYYTVNANGGTEYTLGDNSAISNKVMEGGTPMTRIDSSIFFNNSPLEVSQGLNAFYPNNNGAGTFDPEYKVQKKDENGNPVVDENGNPVYETMNKKVLTNGIKVRVKSNSTDIFVIASNNVGTRNGYEDIDLNNNKKIDENENVLTKLQTRYLGVYKITSNEKDSNGKYLKDENGKFVTDDFEQLDFDDRIKTKDYFYTESWPDGKKDIPTFQLALPAKKSSNDPHEIVACEFSLDDTGPGTYFIASVANSVNIYYLAVTGTTQGEEGGGDDTTYSKQLLSIDFTYKKTSDQTFHLITEEGFNRTNVVVNFTSDINETFIAMYIYFIRSDDDGKGAVAGSATEEEYTLEVYHNGADNNDFTISEGTGTRVGNCYIKQQTIVTGGWGYPT